jgi:hypothetical protein
MAVFVYRAPWFFGTSGSLSTPLFQACNGGVSACLSFQSVSIERRFQKLDLDPQQLVFDYLSADAVGASNLFHGLGAAEELVDLLDTLAQAVVCLPLSASSIPCQSAFASASPSRRSRLCIGSSSLRKLAPLLL